MIDHSSEPWRSEPGPTPDSIKIVAADGVTVCTFRNANNPDDPEQMANVRLVKASPRVLARLRQLFNAANVQSVRPEDLAAARSVIDEVDTP